MHGNSGDSYDFGARIHDARLGRFLSVDPLTAEYPNYSPYLFAGNNPIYYLDREGRDQIEYLITISETGKVQLQLLYFDGDNNFTPDYTKATVVFGSTSATYYFTNYGTNGDGSIFAPKGGGHNNLDQWGAFFGGLLSNPVATLSNPNYTTEAQIRQEDITDLAFSLALGAFFKQRASAQNTKQQQSSNEGVSTSGEKKIQVGTYEEMAKSNVKTGKSADHIPSYGALKTQTESLLGRELTPIEAKNLRNKALTMVYETEIHQTSSRTYGGRNNKAKQASDAANLYNAVKKDVDALKPKLLEAGYSETEINEASEKLLAPYKPK